MKDADMAIEKSKTDRTIIADHSSDEPIDVDENQLQQQTTSSSTSFITKRNASMADEYANQSDQHLSVDHSANKRWQTRRSLLITGLILTLGAAASSAFLALGITAAQKEETDQFQRVAREYIKQLENDWTDYQTAGLWTHQATRRSHLNNTSTRTDFTELYENLLADGLEFQAICWLPNVTHEQRATYEAEAIRYYDRMFPDFQYRGFHDTYGVVRQPQDFYFPIHYVEPFVGNEDSVGLDMYSNKETVDAIEKSLRTYKPAVSARLRLVNQTSQDAYGIFLMHPGIQISALPDMVSKDLSLMEIRIPALLRRTTKDFQATLTVYLYDTTANVSESEQFLGGVQVDGNSHEIQFLPERQLKHVSSRRFDKSYRMPMVVADRTWTAVILASRETYKPNYTYIILGSVLIFVGCAFLAAWEWSNKKRTAKYNELHARAQAERQALVAESGYRKRERDLNDYMAHEIRNPVAAAISASCFVKEAILNDTSTIAFDDPAQKETLQEDVTVVDNSLHFINDLLRNMLDMHRASSNQLQIEMAPTDLLKDVFEPVDSMLYRRNNPSQQVQVVLECPEHLVIVSDRLRLKQIILNLGRNSSKFVEHGFIRLKAEVNEQGNVQLSVEDSGVGVPVSKRDHLFEKFQESLDSLSQGTGIGLHLCKDLAELMGGELYFDETYSSGIEERPGARFVVDLKVPPYQGADQDEETLQSPRQPSSDPKSSEEKEELELPETLSVLFVDDDFVLRKLFSRSLRKALPGWTIQEASNGETAIRLVETETFDVIFMDQYMASVERQLLGTETVRALRTNGVTCRICGLSANDMQQNFKDCGADAFMMKPFPCEPDALKSEMRRVLFEGSCWEA